MTGSFLTGIAFVIILLIIFHTMRKRDKTTKTASATANTTSNVPAVITAPSASPVPAASTPQAPITMPASTAPAWTRADSMSYVFGAIAPQYGSADGNVKYLGNTATQDDCENSCQGNQWCKAYTWYNGNNGDYNYSCYGVNNPGSQTPTPNQYSGIRKESFGVGDVMNGVNSVVNTASNVANNVVDTVKQTLGMKEEPKPETFDVKQMWTNVQTSANTFSNTLQRRLGMESAGGSEHFGTNACVGTFDCDKQNFSSARPVGFNTEWDNYQHSSVLPI